MSWVKTYWWRIPIGVAAVAILISAWNETHEDPFAPSTYAAAAGAMRTLPGIACPSSVPSANYTCVWDDWTLTLTPNGTRPGLCRGKTAHVVFGGSAWTIRLTPTQADTDPPPPTGSSPKYAELLDAFNFGNGANWMAC